MTWCSNVQVCGVPLLLGCQLGQSWHKMKDPVENHPLEKPGMTGLSKLIVLSDGKKVKKSITVNKVKRLLGINNNKDKVHILGEVE